MLRCLHIMADVPASSNKDGLQQAFSECWFTNLEMKDDVAMTLKLNAALRELYALCPDARIVEFHVGTPREGNT